MHVRDELANMVWGIERIVPLANGKRLLVMNSPDVSKSAIGSGSETGAAPRSIIAVRRGCACSRTRLLPRL
jgi:hypothetical protein